MQLWESISSMSKRRPQFVVQISRRSIVTSILKISLCCLIHGAEVSELTNFLIFSSNAIFVGLTMITHDEHTWICRFQRTDSNRSWLLVGLMIAHRISNRKNIALKYFLQLDNRNGVTGVTITFAQCRHVFGCKTTSSRFHLTYLVYFPFVFFAYIHSLLFQSFHCLLVLPSKV